MDTPAPATRSKRWRAVLLSALGFPGLGQLTLRRYLLAVLFGAGSVVLVGVLLQRVYVETQARMPQDPEEVAALLLDNPAWPLQLAQQIEHDNAALFAWTGGLLVLLWLLSIADAWWATRGNTAAPVERQRSPRVD